VGACGKSNHEDAGDLVGHVQHGAGGLRRRYSRLCALKRARHATEKYQDVSSAEADGYRAYGLYMPGMGLHYGNALGARGTFDIEHPPILLYEKDELSSMSRLFSVQGDRRT
jgi:hypothetical protein